MAGSFVLCRNGSAGPGAGCRGVKQGSGARCCGRGGGTESRGRKEVPGRGVGMGNRKRNAGRDGMDGMDCRAGCRGVKQGAGEALWTGQRNGKPVVERSAGTRRRNGEPVAECGEGVECRWRDAGRVESRWWDAGSGAAEPNAGTAEVKTGLPGRLGVCAYCLFSKCW